MTLEVSSKLNVSVILSCSFNSLQFSLAVAADAAQGEMFPFHFAPVARAVVLLGEKKKKKWQKNHISCRKKKRAHWCLLGIRGSGLLVSVVVSPLPQALGAAVWDDQAELPHFSGSELHNLRVCYGKRWEVGWRRLGIKPYGGS